ncbi:MAG: AAA family ATPase [Thermodesulfobacteriota bacterium]
MGDLEIKKSIEEIDGMYKENVGEEDTLGALVSGDPGVGKTTMITTAPKPILIYMFDPKGQIVVKRNLKKNEYRIVPLWKEQSQTPTEWKRFVELSEKHMELGLFNIFATVAIDSLTFALEACTNYVADFAPSLKMEASYTNRPRNLPFLGDYRIIYQEVLDRIKRFSGYPINLIVTSHLETSADELTGEIKANILAFKKLKGLIPPLFTEKYVIVTKPGPDGFAKRILLTQPKGRYIASSQLGLEPKEEPDFKMIMEKAGLSIADKELLK